MKRPIIGNLVAAVVVTAAYAVPASAVPVLCENAAVNHMYIDSAFVSACVDAGVGNVNGNPLTDDFLLQNPGIGYTGIGSGNFVQLTKTSSNTTGTFSLDSNLWDDWNSMAIGFKFGTGGYADQWFVYLLNPIVSSGSWRFVNVFHRGGGLSHIQLYGVEPTEVPEPGTLGLLGLGLASIGFMRRRKNR